MPEKLLEVKNLNVSFNARDTGVNAVEAVSFKLHRGEILGIVGESGSGKSVTARAISGLLPKNAKVSGEVIFKGQELTAIDERVLKEIRGRDISMIFQNPSSHLDPLMTIGKHIGEPLKFHSGATRSEARAQAVKRLEEVHIPQPLERVNSYPHQLSGGMKQRAMIATAIACNPDLLIADEPTTALDVTVQAHILELLESLNQSSGLSIILISHDLAVVAQTCDRILVMRGGRVIEQGETRTVLSKPKHAYTQLLLDSQPGNSKRSPANAVVETKDSACLLAIDNLDVEFDLPGKKSVFHYGKSRNKFKALDDISLKVYSGESLGVVGESGSGKSTLARTIVGLVEPTRGTVKLQGKELQLSRRSSTSEYAQSIQMVFQNPFDALNPRMTVQDIVGEPLRVHQLVESAQIKNRILELLECVEFDPLLANRKPLQLSGGQCQRIGIARALAMKPEILIADEITSALDVTIQAQILKLLDHLKQDLGLTIIFISHDLNLVKSFCDRVCVFRSGRLVESGDVLQVMKDPETEYTRTLIASAPELSLDRGAK